MATHACTRQIGIDMGHRVPDHGSKCRSLHGHRYTIEAMCRGPLASVGEQNGMVVDFGFLKTVMMEEIDAPFDHALCLFKDDAYLALLMDQPPAAVYSHVTRAVDNNGGKLVIVDRVPTAENLAALWFEQMAPRVEKLSAGRASLIMVKVWETPNCWAAYPV